MADTTIPLNAGSGGADLAVDDIAGAVYQYVGMTYGGSGSKTAVSNSNPMPVKIGDGTDYALVNGSGELTVKHADAIPVTDNGGSLTVDGTVEVTGTVDLGANSGVDIGDVDVTSVTPGTGATNLGKAEDAVHASGDVGVMALSVRTNTAISRAGTDGDYQPLITDTNGRLHVLDQNSAAALTSLAVIDDWDESDRAKVNIIAGQAGITGGAGSVGASTPRVTLASDDPGVALLTTIDADTGNLGAVKTAVEAIQAAVEGTLTVTGGGGGTEYTEGDTDSSITGGVMMMEGAANTVLPVQGTVSDGLLVNLGGNNDVTVTGTVDLGATDNAVLDDIAAKLATIDADTSALFGTVAGSELQVDVLTMPTITVNSHAVTNAGTFVVQENGAALTALQLIDDAVATTGSATPAKGILAVGTDGTNARALKTDSSGELQVDILSIAAGSNAIGKLAANSGVDIGDVDVTSISAGTSLIGDVGIQGRTTGGLSIFRSIDLDETEEEIKGSAGTLYSILAFNRTAAPLCLKFYDNTAAGTTVGSTTPVMTFVVPANADSDGAGFTHSVAQGYAFSTGITVAATTGIADSDTGAPGTNDCVIVVGYK